MQPIIKASPHWVGSRDNPRTRTGGWLEKMANGTSSFSHSVPPSVTTVFWARVAYFAQCRKYTVLRCLQLVIDADGRSTAGEYCWEGEKREAYNQLHHIGNAWHSNSILYGVNCIARPSLSIQSTHTNSHTQYHKLSRKVEENIQQRCRLAQQKVGKQINIE